MLTARPVPIQWHPDLSVFASEPFLKSVGDHYGWLGGFDPAGKLRCVLPYTIVRKAILRMVRFRVETIPLEEEISLEEERSFLNSAMGCFRSMGAGVVIPATTNTIFRTFPDGSVAAPYGTCVLDLDRPEDALWSGISSNHRRQIRLAQKSGVQMRQAPELVEATHAMVRNTFGKSDLPFMGPVSFQRMLQGLGESVRILVAEAGGKVQASIVVPFSRHTAYYVYGGSVANAAPGAMHLLHWEAIKLFRSLGVARYDFVGVRVNPEPGSKQEGLLTFKQRFGGRLVQGYMWKYPLRRLNYLLYCLAARLRSKGDIVDNERHKLGKQSPPDAEVAPAFRL